MSVPGRDHFWPKDDTLNNLGRSPLGEAMYQISKARAFWFQIRSLFLRFSLYKSMEKMSVPGWGHDLNNLGRGPLGEAMYHISKAWALCFQTKIFLMVFPYMGL